MRHRSSGEGTVGGIVGGGSRGGRNHPREVSHRYTSKVMHAGLYVARFYPSLAQSSV